MGFSSPPCLLQLMLDFQTAMRAKQPVKRLKTQRVKDMSLHPKPILEKRRSGRLQSQPAPNYNEAALDKADAVGGHRQDGNASLCTACIFKNSKLSPPLLIASAIPTKSRAK